MIKKLLAIIVATAFLFVLVSCTSEPSQNEEEDKNENSDTEWINEISMPSESGSSRGLENISTLDLYGNPVDSGIFNNYEITIVDVWGTYCSPCIKAMPVLASLHEKYEDKGVNVIGIVIDIQNKDLSPKAEGLVTAMDITQRTGADFTHILASKNIISSVVRNISAIPASFIVDSEGNVITKILYGGHSLEQWEELINEYI